MMTHPKIIVYSDSNIPVDILSQMTNFFYEVLQVSLTSDLKKLRKMKKVVASIIIKSQEQTAVFKKLKVVRSLFPELPIVMIADSPSQEDIIKAFRLGVTDFLIYPIEAEDLISCLHRNTWLQRNNLTISDSPLKRNWNLIKQSFHNVIRQLRLSPPIKFSPKNIQTSLNSSILPLPIMTGNMSKAKGFSIKMLGKFQISLDGKKNIQLKGHNAKSLLAYLFYHRKRPIHREKLMNMFWPDSLPNCARNCLNVTIHHIRKEFQPLTNGIDIIIYKDECYSINQSHNVEIDIEQFNSFRRKGLAYESTGALEKSIDVYYKAIKLYKGDFIEDLLYEDWCGPERENIKERYLVMLDRLSQYSFRKGNYNSTIELCNIMLKKDNCLEEIHRRLIASYRASGARGKAIKQYKKCAQTLQKRTRCRTFSNNTRIIRED